MTGCITFWTTIDCTAVRILRFRTTHLRNQRNQRPTQRKAVPSREQQPRRENAPTRMARTRTVKTIERMKTAQGMTSRRASSGNVLPCLSQNIKPSWTR